MVVQSIDKKLHVKWVIQLNSKQAGPIAEWSRAREGVIINDHKTTLFNELVTLENVILTSRNDVREMQDNVNDPETTLGADF